MLNTKSHVETTLNTYLAELLDKMRYNWTALPEQRGILSGLGQIDVLVSEDGWPRVIIECKIGIKPEDVSKRFDETFRDDGTTPSIIFEVKYDEVIHTKNDLENTKLLYYCVHYDKERKFPHIGWLQGSVQDLSVAIQYGRESIQDMESVDILSKAIEGVADKIGKFGVRDEISHIMAQDVSEQTDAMAALTLAGAISFHDMAARSKPNKKIPLLNSVMFSGMADIAALLDAWRRILEINYYPIFDPAMKILSNIPIDKASGIIGDLYNANSRIIAQGLGSSPDLYGQTFQRLIADRKKLAAFYTKPASAALLTALTIPDEWLDKESVKSIHIADFACGTGTLLLSAYKQLASRYEAASGKSMRDIHPHMMAECLIGADVLPIAAHLTAAGLTSMYPKKHYETTRIYQPEQGGPNHRIGSLEWMKQDATLIDTEQRLTGNGQKGEKSTPAHGSCDVIIMNPPYVGSQGPGGRSDKTDKRQLFTAFGATKTDVEKMGRAASKLFKNPPKRTTYCAEKRSLATFFMDLANAKLKCGGYLGLVLPTTAATGKKWEKFRHIIQTQYTDIVVVGGNFSADTGMKEIIISARKIETDEKPSGRGIFVTLDRMPESSLEGICVGVSIWDTRPLRMEDRPQGGTYVMVGDDEIGTIIDCPLDSEWPVDVVNPILSQITHHIKQNSLYVPPSFIPIELKTVSLRNVADTGTSHLQIKGADNKPGYSGQFNVREWRRGSLYPALWNNYHETQQQMTVSPDKSLEVRAGADDAKVQDIVGKASHLHMNVDTRTTSQHLMASYTKELSVGGTSWPSIIASEDIQKGLVVWCNSTLGILCRWAMSNHPDPGRSRSSRTAILDLTVPEKESLEKLTPIYDKFKTRKFDRIMNLWKDLVRIEMDDAVLNTLGIQADLDYIRKHLCAEPSINGGKSTVEF